VVCGVGVALCTLLQNGLEVGAKIHVVGWDVRGQAFDFVFSG
jgi:hypothetical protein